MVAMANSTELVRKLHPRRFPGMSHKFGAILGFILEQHWTNPQIAEMIVTVDGNVMGRVEGDVGLNEWFGPLSELRDNWTRLLNVAGLTAEERAEAERLFNEKIRKF